MYIHCGALVLEYQALLRSCAQRSGVDDHLYIYTVLWLVSGPVNGRWHVGLGVEQTLVCAKCCFTQASGYIGFTDGLSLWLWLEGETP